MPRKHLLTTVLLLFASALAPAASPPSDGPAVTHVIVLDVGRDMPKFLELAKRASQIAQKNGDPGKARYWSAAFAGPNSGSVIVTVEYPSFVSFAQASTKMQASPEWQKLVADAQASSIKPISDSIVVEIKSET